MTARGGWTKAAIEQERERARAAKAKAQYEGIWVSSTQAHVEYQTRPLDWIEEKLGVPRHTLVWSLNEGYEGHKWDGDEDPLLKILEAIADWKDVGVESATGPGKTFLSACITLWFLACFPDSLVPTVAPKASQLLGQIWKEIGKLWPKFKIHFPQAELLTGVLRMKPAVEEKEVWAAWAFVCGVGANEESATKAQGIHGEHVLFITEETPGINSAIMVAISETRTDDHNLHLALGNPDHQQDELHKFCTDEDVVHIRISAFDHPNIVTGRRIVPGAIGLNRLNKRIRKLGKGSRLYESRIRGISPKEAEDALIKWAWCVAAANRYGDDRFRQGDLALGVDVADTPSGDNASIARGQGACLTEVESFKVKEDAGEIGPRVYKEATDRENPIEPKRIGVDSVGVGASVVNDLRKLGMRIKKVSGNAKAIPEMDVESRWSATDVREDGTIKAAGPKVVETEEYDNLRSQVWWRMREDLRLGRIALPNDEMLFQDLTTPTYETRNGAICVESKREIRKRLGRSPDKGDAACYWNWVRDRRPMRREASEEEMKAAGIVVPGPNRDIGLEKMFKRMKREQAIKERQMARMFRPRRR
jgi:hypothetical protein